MSPTQDRARAEIKRLVEDYNRLTAGLGSRPNDRKALLTEADVVNHLIRPLFAALDWPTGDPDRFRYEQHTAAGRPDITFIPEHSVGKIYVEAKKLGVIEDLAAARTTIRGVILPGQMSLPGMAVDRTKEEQQAINYAFFNGGHWAILTNFEKLRVFNARRDWLVFSFERPAAYLEDFDELWELSYERILQGSLEALSNQRYREDVDQGYLSFINEWRQNLAQDIVDHLDKNPWAVRLTGEVDLDLLRSVVQRVLDRLVVVRFAEDHYVIDAGTLEQAQQNAKNPYGFTLGEMVQRLYRNFDKRHNSALFAPDYADEAVFTDTVLSDLITRLYGARYRAMTPDIMGNTYEQYLGKTLVKLNGVVKTADNLETRKKQGSYYTPQVIVRYLVDNSLGRYLYGTANGQPDGEPLEGESRKTWKQLSDLRLLDPACGSGSFLIYAYEVLADFYRAEVVRLEREAAAYAQRRAGEGASPLELQMESQAFTAPIVRLLNYPRIIVEQHLYGVDLDPQAAEIATVNLIMRAMSDLKREKSRLEHHSQQSQSDLLPLILNQNVKIGNSLVGAGPADPRYAHFAPQLAQLRAIRAEMVAGDHDEELSRRFREVAAPVVESLNEPLKPCFEDVFTRRPFHWAVEFPEVFVDEQGQHRGESAGFTVVVGNPPWEIVKPDLREFYAQFDPDIESRYTRAQAEQRIKELDAEDPAREVLWQIQSNRIAENADYFRAKSDYQWQGQGDTATQKLFLERVWRLLRDDGQIGYLIPAGIYRDVGTRHLRETMLDQGQILFMFSFSNERGFFPGVHHDFRFTMLGARKGQQSDGFLTAFRFNPRVAVAPNDLASFLADPTHLVYIRRKSLEFFSPDTLSLMEFQTEQDYLIAERAYNEWPMIGSQQNGAWKAEFAREFDMANDSALFNQSRKGLPLYEGKMIHQFNAFFAEPRYWIDESAGMSKLQSSSADMWFRGYRFAFREVSNATNERTCIATILPANTFAGHTLWVGVTPDEYKLLYFVAIINSLCVDWLARFKVNTHVTLSILSQLPMPRLTQGNLYFDAIVSRAAQLTCTRQEFAALWQSVMDSPWSPSCGAADPAERQRLRDEIDALVAHLYGLSHADFEHILGAFPLVFPDADAGRARKDALLRAYDEFAPQVKDWPRQ